MIIEIDKKSGFCFGVANAISKAEQELELDGKLYCLGDIVHNSAEINRLSYKGMQTITREEFFTLKNCRVLIRAHGEPPETYEYAKNNNIELIDATCPIVIKIQERIKNSYKTQIEKNGQVVIFGKPGHAEVEGLNGQIGYQAIIIQNKEEIDKIDFTRPISLFSQTTMPLDEFRKIELIIREKAGKNVLVESKDTVCRQVSNRSPHLEKFAAQFDVVVFVAGRKSSNGAVLFEACKKANPDSFKVSDADEVKKEWFAGVKKVGICGATSTPLWLMENVAKKIESFA